MKTTNLVLTIFVLAILWSCNRTTTKIDQLVNPVIGDISYFEAFGQEATKETDNHLRVQSHLKYVEQLLRSKDVSGLTAEKRENRVKILDLLKAYWTAGVFPKNYDYPEERRPCFIDKDGTICAVGYLVEQTAGRKAAEEINSKFKYEYLLAMNDETLDTWVETSGLTKEECAMIQPTYGPEQPVNHITTQYGVTSSVVGGLNVSLSMMNSIQMVKGANSRVVPIFGLVSGAGQIALGAFSYPKLESTWNGTYINASQRDLSLLNIGLGTSTMILSSWNLLTKRKPKEKSYSWNLYSFPTQGNNVGLGFSFSKRF